MRPQWGRAAGRAHPSVGEGCQVTPPDSSGAKTPSRTNAWDVDVEIERRAEPLNNRDGAAAPIDDPAPCPRWRTIGRRRAREAGCRGVAYRATLGPVEQHGGRARPAGLGLRGRGSDNREEEEQKGASLVRDGRRHIVRKVPCSPGSLDRYAVSYEDFVLVVGDVQAAVFSPTARRSASRSVTTRW